MCANLRITLYIQSTGNAVNTVQTPPGFPKATPTNKDQIQCPHTHTFETSILQNPAQTCRFFTGRGRGVRFEGRYWSVENHGQTKKLRYCNFQPDKITQRALQNSVNTAFLPLWKQNFAQNTGCLQLCLLHLLYLRFYWVCWPPWTYKCTWSPTHTDKIPWWIWIDKTPLMNGFHTGCFECWGLWAL